MKEAAKIGNEQAKGFKHCTECQRDASGKGKVNLIPEQRKLTMSSLKKKLKNMLIVPLLST